MTIAVDLGRKATKQTNKIHGNIIDILCSDTRISGGTMKIGSQVHPPYLFVTGIPVLASLDDIPVHSTPIKVRFALCLLVASAE